MIGLSGRFRSSLIIGGQGIRARKLRTLLSMISLFLGVLAVVVVQAGSEITTRAMLSNIELTEGKDGTLLLYLPSDPKAVPIAVETLRGHRDAVGSVGMQAIIGEPGVTPVNAGGSPFGDDVSYGGFTCDASGNCRDLTAEDRKAMPAGQAIELQLTALTGDVRRFRPYRPVSGRWLDFDATPSLSPGIVLNKEAAEGFSRYRVPAEMRLEGSTANPTPRIVGVVDDGQQQPNAYVRMDELANWLPANSVNTTRYGGMSVLLSPTATDVEQTLRARLVAAGMSANDVHAQPIQSRKQIASELALMRWIFLGMAALVLLIGVAGILNVGLATVGERVEEFALRRAVGTPRSLLAGIVLAETLLTGLFTAGVAIGVGAAALEVASALFGGQEAFLRDLTFPWQAGVAGIAAGLIAGVLGGLIPAIRAAGIPIATVMRA